MEKLDKLTEVQRRVMAYVGRGWSARVSHGSAIEVNGKRVCNLSTIMVLHRKGLVAKDQNGLWIATESGKILTHRLAL